jgi:imidazolonepropionase-like amidohydrolase
MRQFLGKGKRSRHGGVGKGADLLLLVDDPLQDVEKTSRYAVVMVRGRWLDGDAMRRALTD